MSLKDIPCHAINSKVSLFRLSGCGFAIHRYDEGDNLFTITRTKYDAESLKARYMVQNLVCCETCRRRLRVFSTEWSCNYKDYSDERELECKDDGKQIQAPFLDNLVSNFVSSINLPRNWIDQIIARGSETDTCRELKEQITRVRNRMERRRDAYTVSGVHHNFEKYERDQKADQQLIDELTQKLPKDSVAINTQITLTTSLLDLFIITSRKIKACGVE